MIRHILDRMKEPSTYAGVTGLLAVFGLNVDPGLIQSFVAVLAAISGLASILLGEKLK